MKSWKILILFTLPLLAIAQEDKPLSSRVEELLKAKQKKRAKEDALIEKIKSEAILERLEIDRKRKLEELKKKQIKKAIESRFIPRNSFLNFKPEEFDFLWTIESAYSFSKYTTDENMFFYQDNTSDNIQKKFKRKHLLISNQLEYGWDKKLSFKYKNTYHVFQKTENTSRLVDGQSIAKDPPLKNKQFGDHEFEASYRARKEIFYGHDLDYFLRIIYPFGSATRAYAYGDGSGSNSTETTASQEGNLKSPFIIKPIFGLDFFFGKDRNRYQAGGGLGYATKGKYSLNKGTGFFSTNPSGLNVDTESYVDLQFWLNYQKRAKVLEKTFYGAGLWGYFTFDQREKISTVGADGFSWVQTNAIKSYLKLKTSFWVTYKINDKENLKLTMNFTLPYSYDIEKRIIDEGADGGGNRQFFAIQSKEKIKSKAPMALSFSYSLSF